MTLSRSLVAENSPYYESGARVLYKPGKGLFLSALILNGWQTIQRSIGQQRPAFGTQLQVINAAGTLLNWSTYWGTERPDSLGVWRLYNNFYATVEGVRSRMAVGLDVGVQQRSVERNEADGWIALVAVARRRFAKRWWANGRIEYFVDDHGLATAGVSMLGASAGLDLMLDEHAWWRVESRFLVDAEDRFLMADGTRQQLNTAFTTSFCLKF